ncbi:transcriptional regulator CBF1 [Entomortierella parvispora]|uniref:Transcriptional regulator CBF1 n=1 Tax=Entomortierella parvispora TaxID=205924 RepID=A0A9P3H370_9FUNG|nr:transcriptional regulator CBF1 [Entomortierella parvispora]
MTSSAEIHNVQEVLNELTNSMKDMKDMKDMDMNQTFTAVIAQHTAAQKARAEAEAQAVAQAVVEQQQHQVSADQLGHDELTRIAEQHREEMAAQEVVSAAAPLVSAPLVASAPGHQVIHMDALDGNDSSTLATVAIPRAPSPVEAPTTKPLPGTEEWAKIRRDNHKEVERRRRETINEGINELAKVVPSSEKNKGAILRQAVKYIHSIQETHDKLSSEVESVTALVVEREKALLDKNLAQSALRELHAQHEQLKRDFESLRSEYERVAESKKQRTE